MIRLNYLFLLVALSLQAASWHAEAEDALELPAIFADRMVLQRGDRVPVWGWAEPGTAVTVGFNGQKKNNRNQNQRSVAGYARPHRGPGHRKNAGRQDVECDTIRWSVLDAKYGANTGASEIAIFGVPID